MAKYLPSDKVYAVAVVLGVLAVTFLPYVKGTKRTYVNVIVKQLANCDNKKGGESLTCPVNKLRLSCLSAFGPQCQNLTGLGFYFYREWTRLSGPGVPGTWRLHRAIILWSSGLRRQKAKTVIIQTFLVKVKLSDLQSTASTAAQHM